MSRYSRRLDELERMTATGEHDRVVVVRQIVRDDAGEEAAPFPDLPGEGLQINIVRHITSKRPPEMDEDSFSDDVYRWQRRGWSR